MFNKLNYYKRLHSASTNTNLLGSDFYCEIITKYYAEQLGLSVTLKPLCLGTLGIKFICYSRLPYPLFLKTHELLDTDGREAIEREYECMRKINSSKMHIKLHILNIDYSKQRKQGRKEENILVVCLRGRKFASAQYGYICTQSSARNILLSKELY